jgi:hypothetical protein
MNIALLLLVASLIGASHDERCQAHDKRCALLLASAPDTAESGPQVASAND